MEKIFAKRGVLMGKYDVKESGINSYRYIRFDSVKSFYFFTRGKRLDNLTTELWNCIYPNTKVNRKSSEYKSWNASLPDLAKLLYKPEQYYQDVKAEAEKHRKTADRLFANIQKLTDKHLESKTYFEKYTQGFIKSQIEASLNATLENYKSKIVAVEKDDLSFDLDLEIFLEYPMLLEEKDIKPHRCDVILHHKKPDGKDRYAIIELKQYTEGFETDNEPWEQVENYEKCFNSKRKAKATGLVYLHNQMYYGGELFERMGIKKTCEGIMYNKGCCGNFIAKLKKVLTSK